jgi:hypothetical protein
MVMATAPDGIALWTPSRIFPAGDVAVYQERRYVAFQRIRNRVQNTALRTVEGRRLPPTAGRLRRSLGRPAAWLIDDHPGTWVGWRLTRCPTRRPSSFIIRKTLKNFMNRKT